MNRLSGPIFMFYLINRIFILNNMLRPPKKWSAKLDIIIATWIIFKTKELILIDPSIKKYNKFNQKYS